MPAAEWTRFQHSLPALQHGYKGEGLKAFLLEAAIGSFGEAHHPLHVCRLIDRDDHHAARAELFDEERGNLRGGGGDDHLVKGGEGG